jgi:simple sugar transport system permease protein
MTASNQWIARVSPALRVLLAFLAVLLAITVILLMLGKNPIGVASELLRGALGDANSRADVIMFALPILLCASGLLITFTAGLWNIGIEGQITFGAIFATILARSVTASDSPWIVLPAELILAMVGGGLWAGVAALLRVYGNVNEIFGGVALNFIAQNILISLLNGPWKAGTYSSTAPFAAPALLPSLPGTRLSVVAIVLTLIAYAVVFVVLRGTHWGLQLKAMGRSERSALLLGVRTKRNMIVAIIACGAFAGLVGATQALFTRGKLIPDISGGIGFVGILVVLLIDLRAAWLPLIAILLAIVPVGGLKLSMALDDATQVDTSLGNVFQSALVLAVLLGNGLRAKSEKQTPSETPVAVPEPADSEGQPHQVASTQDRFL